MPKELPFRGANGRELFEVSNYEDSYLGTASLWSATATSDNSVFAELGMQVKPRRVARIARRMGIRTELSTNPAMLLGGLEQGVTPLEMAYAYSTLANEGSRVSGTLAPNETGPVAIERVEGGPGPDKVNDRVEERVFPKKVGQVAKDMLSLVVTSGTGEAAQVGEEVIWGKTGTTENYGDAWFVGSNDDLTVAVWVGYADKLQPMEYEYAGSPVAGGTYPAVIFSDFMSTWLELREARGLTKDEEEEDGEGALVPTPDTYIAPPADEDALPAEPVVPEEEAPVEEPQADPAPAPEQTDPPVPEQPAPVEPAPVPETPVPPEDTGGGVTPEGAGE
jgi:penicillin-binding protein 1A